MSKQPSFRTRLSKFLSLVLQHQPELIGLTLDPDGFVSLEDLLAAMRRDSAWRQVTEEQVREVVATCEKQRFELIDGRIRARYGHSVESRIEYAPVEPPEILYHGTSPDALPGIRRQGLRSMRRQYVHLSTEEKQAYQVGRRHHPSPIILPIRAHAAWSAGVPFYQPEPRLFLADSIPPEFVETDALTDDHTI